MAKTNMRDRRKMAALMLVAALAATAAAPGLSGELEPPVPPGNPTMKPLTELEARWPIYAGMLPMTISEPGSYYLAEPINTDGAGITIASSFVTIDLNGFALQGGVGNGITIAESSSPEGVVIRNGFVSGWPGWGIDLAPSIHGAEGVEVLDVILLRNGNGLRLYSESVLRRCTALYNDGIGIDAGYSTVVTDCVVRGNKTGPGLIAGTDTVVVHTEVSANEGHGVILEQGAQLRDSTVSMNDGHGVDVTGVAVLVTGNAIKGNGSDGIRVQDYSVVRGNLCVFNGRLSDDGAGIRLLGESNRAEDNELKDNDIGLFVQGQRNVLARNTMDGNTQDWGRDPSVTHWLFLLWTVASPDMPNAWSNMESGSLIGAP